MRFLHITDIHLGYQQYNSPDRFNDFAFAFEHAVSYGIEQQVDAILIAGDLFHKPTVEPWAFIQATETLGLARQANVPVIAIEGNHDQARYRDQISWLEVLAHEGYLILLKPILEGETAVFEAWDGTEGGYVDIGNMRIIGVHSLGAAMGPWLPEIAAAIENLPHNNINCTVLLTHVGVEGEIPNVPGCLTYAQLERLRPFVDYLALGHLHKPFERDEWVYNPGSLEVYAIDECLWPKGMYDVTVEDDGRLATRYVKSPHRPFYREPFQTDKYKNPPEIYRALRDVLRQRAATWKQGAVVEVSLEGILQFDHSDLDLEVMQQAIKDEAAPLIARVSISRLKLRDLEVAVDESLPQAELELSVLREIALSDSRYAAQPDAWADVMLEVKDLVLDDRDPETILEALQIRMDEMVEEASDADHVS